MGLDKQSIEERITVMQNQLLNDGDHPDFERPGRYINHLNEIKAMQFCVDNDIPAIQARIRELRQAILTMNISKLDDIVILMRHVMFRNVMKEVIGKESVNL